MLIIALLLNWARFQSSFAKMDSFKPFEKMILILNEDGSVTSDSTNSVRRMMRFK